MRLWRNQGFAVFWSARTISFAGTGITIVVLPVLVYGMTGSPAWVASLGLIEAVPYLGLGLLAGAVADRMNRKKIMVGCDVTAALLLAAVPAAAALHRLGIAQVPIVFGASPAKRIPCPVSSGSRCSASGAGRAAVAARRRGY